VWYVKGHNVSASGGENVVLSLPAPTGSAYWPWFQQGKHRTVC
jgi:hypothetical protein